MTVFVIYTKLLSIAHLLLQTTAFTSFKKPLFPLISEIKHFLSAVALGDGTVPAAFSQVRSVDWVGRAFFISASVQLPFW